MPAPCRPASPQNYANNVEIMGEGYTTGISNSFYSFLLGLLM